MFDALVAAAGVVAGAVAAVAGFGIGSLLTPLLALRYGTRLAVAVVSVPHLAGTALRLARLWRRVDRGVFVRFGILSAAGGLCGAWLNARAHGPWLTLVFGLLLVFAGTATLTGLSQRMRFGRRVAWLAGGVSGLFGGLVGNQGGIRSAALLGFDLDKQAFVATATAIGIVVDAARMPVYAATQGADMLGALVPMAAATTGVLLGTMWGVRGLRHIPERFFRPAVGALIAALGVFELARALAR